VAHRLGIFAHNPTYRPLLLCEEMSAGSAALKTYATHKAIKVCPWSYKPSSEAIEERNRLYQRWNKQCLGSEKVKKLLERCAFEPYEKAAGCWCVGALVYPVFIHADA